MKDQIGRISKFDRQKRIKEQIERVKSRDLAFRDQGEPALDPFRPEWQMPRF
jgi:hypothetical protein